MHGDILQYKVSGDLKAFYKQRQKKFLQKQGLPVNFKRSLSVFFRGSIRQEPGNVLEYAAYNPSKINYVDLLEGMGHNPRGYVNKRDYCKQMTDAVPKKIAALKTS